MFASVSSLILPLYYNLLQRNGKTDATMKIKRDGHLSWAIKAANHVGTREAFGQKIWQMIETIIGLRVCYLGNSGGTFLCSLTAGGSLLSLGDTREHVCLLCLEACLQYLVRLPIWFLTGLEFSRHKQALCKESMDLVF